MSFEPRVRELTPEEHQIRKVRPVIVDISVDRQKMLRLAHKCRMTGRHLKVEMVRRQLRASVIRFPVYIVLCWTITEGGLDVGTE